MEIKTSLMLLMVLGSAFQGTAMDQHTILDALGNVWNALVFGNETTSKKAEPEISPTPVPAPDKDSCDLNLIPVGKNTEACYVPFEESVSSLRKSKYNGTHQARMKNRADRYCSAVLALRTCIIKEIGLACRDRPDVNPLFHANRIVVHLIYKPSSKLGFNNWNNCGSSSSGGSDLFWPGAAAQYEYLTTVILFGLLAFVFHRMITGFLQ